MFDKEHKIKKIVARTTLESPLMTCSCLASS